jgi:hypothetical protein
MGDAAGAVMTPYRDPAVIELALEAQLRRLAPLIRAADGYQKIRPVRDLLTSIAAFLGAFTFLIAAIPRLAVAPWRGAVLLLHGGALLALFASAAREAYLRHRLAGACKEHDGPLPRDCEMHDP